MELKQIENLIEFTLLFNKSCDNSVFASNYDYIIEKFNKFINVDVKDTIQPTSTKVEMLLINYTSRWGVYESDNDAEKNKVVNILSYLLEINENNRTNKITPVKMYKLFEKYIGDPKNITNNDNDFRLHVLLLRDTINPYIKRFNRQIKLLILI
jgi:hypothetical protein